MQATTLTARMSSAPRRFDAARLSVELGHEPAIEIGGGRVDSRERRRIPVRWLLGVALTGLTGAVLIGSTLYLDLDRKSNFAEAPEFASASHGEAGADAGVNPGKGDRLVRPLDIVAAKQDFRAPMTMKIGDREVIKDRPYTLLSTTLTTAPTAFADAVPTFNPLKLANSGAEKADATQDLEPAPDDAEAGFTTRDLTRADADKLKGELNASEAQAQVSAWAKRQNTTERLPALAPQMMLMRTSRAGIDPLGALSYATTGMIESNAPFSTIEVRLVAENVTSIPRASEDLRSGSERRRLVATRHGQTFEELLLANGASPAAATAILAAFGVAKGDSPVGEGQKIILEFEDGSAAKPRIARVSAYADEQLKAIVAMDDHGGYARVNVKGALDETAKAKPRGEGDADQGGMSLYQSLYETGLKQGLPRPIIEDLVRVFINDVDFQRSAQPGDSMVAFMSDPDEFESKPTLFYAAITVRDQIFRYYRFQTPDDNVVDYYDEGGRSSRKFLLRKPIAAGEMTSGFGMRFHPILHFSRLHSGVDWAGPVGTPILAAGNGTITSAAYDSGYGRRVEIQHANGYVTTYNHMSAFGRGVAEGVQVKQGQVIGYLGQSGLATGPHLHYEVLINGNFVDPMAIKLARTREFDGKALSSFKKERDRIDQLIAQAPNASVATPRPAPALSARVN